MLKSKRRCVLKTKAIAGSLAYIAFGMLFGFALSIPAADKVQWQETKAELPYTVTVASEGQYAQMRCTAPLLPPQVNFK